MQLATPVIPDALSSLYNSRWDIVPLLDFAASYLTLDADETYAALNIIAELDGDDAVELVAGKSEVTKSKDSTASGKITPSGNVTLEVTNKSSTGTGTDNSLVIYFLPFHPHATSRDLPKKRREMELWIGLLKLYAGTQPASVHQQGTKCPQNLRYTDLAQAENCVPRSIELRTTPVAPDKMSKAHLISGAPLMRTYSALGILKSATEPPHPRIEFVSPDGYDTIRSYPWNRRVDNTSFYTLPYDTEPDYSVTESEKRETATIAREVSDWIERTNDPFKFESRSYDDYIRGSRQLAWFRRYILIIHSNNAPANAYVAHFDHGEWYYIDADDAISQKNFDLISLFMTMMAVPSATPPLAPTISVGGGG